MNHDIIVITSDNKILNYKYYQMYLNGDSGLVPGDQVSVYGTKGPCIGTVIKSEHNGSFLTVKVK